MRAHHIFSLLHSYFSFFQERMGFISYLMIYSLLSFPCLAYIGLHHGEVGCGAHVAACVALLLALTAALPVLYRLSEHSRRKTLFVIPLLAGICSLVCFPSLIGNKIELVFSLLHICGCMLIMCSIFKKLSVFPLFFWLILPILRNLFSMHYDVEIDPFLIAEIIGASPQDAAQFITFDNILLCALFLLSTFAFCGALGYLTTRYAGKKPFLSGLVILVLTMAAAHACQINIWKRTHCRVPEGIIKEIRAAALLARDMQSDLVKKARALPSAAHPEPYIPTEKRAKRSIVLFHIGESVRSDHLSIFGYERKTTPHLEKRERLIAYPDCISCAPETVAATFAILTNAKTDVLQSGIDSSLDASCSSVMDIFHALGFSCYAFVNSVSPSSVGGGFYEKLLHLTYASQADKIQVIPNPENSLSQIPQIAQTVTEENNSIFCFINNSGSHVPFFDYSQENPPFSPASPHAQKNKPRSSPQTAEKARNAYDSTICRLDDYIEQLLALLQGQPFLYVYIADHGEYVGEHQLWYRNGDHHRFFNSYACQVPFLIIASPEFEQQNPHFQEALKQLRNHSTMSIGHEHIFHTMLGLFGIQTPYYEAELDLTSEKVLPYTGPHPCRNGKATDGKKWY